MKTPDGKLHLAMGRGTVLEPDGSIAWQGEWELNTLADEGEENVLSVYLKETAHLTKFLALLADATIAETDTMATMVEAQTPTANGYNRQAYAAGGGDWGTPALNSGDFQSVGAQKTFGPASGSNWTGITHAAVVTTLTGTAGKFILYIPLSATTTVAIGQSFLYTATIKAT